MGMSHGQDPPKFHLISVPIIQCKPPTVHVPSSGFIGGLGEPDRAVTFARLLHSGPTECALRNRSIDQSDEKDCHSSFPSIPQQCIERAQALLASRDSTAPNTNYFNTIPLKSGPHRRRPDSSALDYRERPPPSSAPSQPAPSQLLGPTAHNLTQVSFTPNGATSLRPRLQIETENSIPNELHQINVDRQQTMHQFDHASETKKDDFALPPVNSTFSQINGSQIGVDNASDRIQSDGVTSFGPQWMEEYINELYARKQLLMQSLVSAEAVLKRLLCEESAITGTLPSTNCRSGSHASLTETNAGRGLHDGETRPSSLMNRLKWRQSRRSKSAHERLPIDQSQTAGNDSVVGLVHQPVILDTEFPRQNSEPNGSITIMRPNDDRTDTTVPKRFLRWWRQNKRRSVVDTKRRQSMGLVNMHWPESITGLAGTELRTRGSSMPPNENRSSSNVTDRELFSERTPNRASLRLHHAPRNDVRFTHIPIGYSLVDSQSSTNQVYRDMPFTSPLALQPASYKCIPLYTPIVHDSQNGVKISDFGSNTIIPSKRSVQSLTGAVNTAAVFPQIHAGEGPVRVTSGMTNDPRRIPISSGEFHGSRNRTPNRWTTIRCRPVCPVIYNDKFASPPPLPPRVTGNGMRVDTRHGIVFGTTRQQLVHPRTAHNTDWSRSALSERPTIAQNGSDKCITRRELHHPNGLPQMSIKSATQFEPIRNRQANDQQYTQRQTTQTMIAPNSTAAERSGMFLKPSCSRMVNGYEICPQPTVLGSRRVQSATVRPSNWNQGQNSMNTVLVDPTWQGRPGSHAHMDDILIRSDSEFAIGNAKQHRTRALDNLVRANIGLSAGRSGVVTIDDCHAALRECLRGWELTGQNTFDAKTRMDFARFSNVDNGSWLYNPGTLPNSHWTRTNVGFGNRSQNTNCLPPPNGSTSIIDKRLQ